MQTSFETGLSNLINLKQQISYKLEGGGTLDSRASADL
jgi:hypothetical protein